MSTPKDNSVTELTIKVQGDWENREFVEVAQLNVLKIVEFLRNFDQNVQYKLANLNSKLNKLERSVDYCDACLNTSLQNQPDTDDH